MDEGTTDGDTTGSHVNADERVLAVDDDDEPIELVNRLEAHTGDGIRHRGFTVLVFDRDRHILLAQRSPTKRLWDTYWDGTVASHPSAEETYHTAARRRLVEELGIEPNQYGDLRLTDVFEYKRYYENAGVEHEICGVLQVTLDDRRLQPDRGEVTGLLWAPYAALAEHPPWYRQLRLCPWFTIAVRRDREGTAEVPE